MRPEILKFCFAQIQRAVKSHHINKPYHYVAGIDNLLVYSAKLAHIAVNFTLLNFASNLSRLKNTSQSRRTLYMSVR